MPSKKLKSAAQLQVPQNKDECAAFIHQMGVLQREHAALHLDMNNQIAAITAKFQPLMEALQSRIDPLFKGVQAWCESNRAQITEDMRVKTANLVTGEVNWRVGMPTCSVTGAEQVIQALKMLGLGSYVRSTEAVNKEMVISTVLAARTVSDTEAANDAAKQKVRENARLLQTLPGLKVVTGVEAFSVVPFEQEVGA
jgi:phage host-nuclease inhibitor protein Gam